MEGYAVIPLTLRSIGGHDVLLHTAHDLLDSIVESSGQRNWNLMVTQLEVCGVDTKWIWMCSKCEGVYSQEWNVMRLIES